MRHHCFCYLPAPSELIPPDQLYLDESVPERVAEDLTAIGIDTTSAAGVGLLNASQTEHLNYATQHSRMLITSVLPLSLYFKKLHSGVLICSENVTAADLLQQIAHRMMTRPFIPFEQTDGVRPLGTCFPKLTRANPPP